MAKKKKTRKHKIAVDLKRQQLKKNLSRQEAKTPLESIALKKEPSLTASIKKGVEKKEEIKKTASEYGYLINDLKKTAILTTSVVTLQIILFLALTNKILIIPGLSY